MAAEYLRSRAAHQGLGHVVVDSAGLLGIEGERAAPAAVEVMRDAGVDLSGHRSRGIRASDFRTADFVIAMTADHLDEMARRFPSGVGRRLLIRAFEGAPLPAESARDLDDPIGLPVAVFRSTFETLRTCVDHLILHLKHAP